MPEAQQMKHLLLVAAMAVCTGSVVGQDAEPPMSDALKRFAWGKEQRDLIKLFTECAPMNFGVGFWPRFALSAEIAEAQHEIGNGVQLAVESRLRSARLYGGEIAGGDQSLSLYTTRQQNVLYVEITLSEPSEQYLKGTAVIDLAFKKRLVDPVTKVEGMVVTWMSTKYVRSSDERAVISATSELMDLFLTEYLRVNEESCGSS